MPVMQKVAANDPLIADMFARFDYDAVARQIVLRTLPTIPGYARMPDAVMMGQILEIVKHNLELFVRCLMDDREPDHAELEVLRASAMQRGREGVPLQDMLHGYRLGAQVAWQSLIDMATADDHRVLLDVAGRVMKYIDGVSTAVAQAYLDEREHLASEQERWTRAMMDALLDESAGREELQRLADKTRFALAEQYRPFAVCLAGAPAREHSRIAIELRTRGFLALTEGTRVSGLAPADATSCGLPLRSAALAVGDPMPRRDLHAGLEFARLQVETASALGHTGVIAANDLLPELLLARSPDLAATLRASVLGPLEDYAEKRSPELLQTLAAFVACGLDRRETAARLYIHANTLDYRLRRIEQLIGRKLGDPADLAAIVLALKQRRLTEH